VNEFFHWDPTRLGLKVREIDQEHEVLIGMMNGPYAAHANNAGQYAQHARLALSA
jgi:hemerythrin